MINYNWKINEVITSDIEGQEDVIVKVTYTVEGEDSESGIKSLVDGYEKFMYFAHEQEEFFPFSSVTAELVIKWIKEKITFSGVNAIESKIQKDILKAKGETEVAPVEKVKTL